MTKFGSPIDSIEKLIEEKKIELRENWLDLQVNGQNKRDEKFWNSNYSIKGLIEEKK